MNFQEWYSDADMPELVDGHWVDLETGIPFSAWTPVKKAARKPPVLEINGKAAKVAEGLAYVSRLALNQSKAIDRAKVQKSESLNLSAYLIAANAAVEAAKTLNEKSKKAEIAAAIKLNQAASRISNLL